MFTSLCVCVCVFPCRWDSVAAGQAAGGYSSVPRTSQVRQAGPFALWACAGPLLRHPEAQHWPVQQLCVSVSVKLPCNKSSVWSNASVWKTFSLNKSWKTPCIRHPSLLGLACFMLGINWFICMLNWFFCELNLCFTRLKLRGRGNKVSTKIFFFCVCVPVAGVFGKGFSHGKLIMCLEEKYPLIF